MSGPVDVLSVWDAQIRYTEGRLANSRKKADDGAQKKGHRVLGADDHCDWIEHSLTQLREGRATVSELIEALQFIAELDPRDTESGFNEWGEAECFTHAQQTARATLVRCGAKS